MLHQSALLAQLVARGSDKAKVIGSSPVESRQTFLGRPPVGHRRCSWNGWGVSTVERAGIPLDPLAPIPGTNPFFLILVFLFDNFLFGTF